LTCTMGLDYYKLLGISKTASEDEIKKAYKKMALKWHPDRNQGSEEATTKFKEISEAFEVLTDSNKRAVYDQFGEEGLKGGGRPTPGAGGPGGFSGFPSGSTFTFTSGPGGGGGGFDSSGGFAPTDPQKIFEQMFGSSFFSGRGGGGGPGQSMFANMSMDDGSFFSGMPGGMPRGRSSPSRSGTFPGRAQSNPPEKPQEITKPLKVSLEDLYNGSVKHLKVGRKLLDGSTEDKVLDIQIQPGWKSGTKIRFPKAGNEVPPMGDAQDLVFIVEEKPHEVYKREDNNLIANLKIPLVEALAGPPPGTKEKVLEFLDGRRLRVPLPFGVIKPGQQTRISGEGMPIRKDGAAKTKGDLIVNWDVVFPDSLTSSQKEGVRSVLG